MSKSTQDLGRFLCFLLRHKPSAANLTMDKHGWVDVDELVNNLKEYPDDVDLHFINKVVQEDEKGRFQLKHGKIRACQGHSILVDLEMEPITPPSILFHGTTDDAKDLILKDGIKSMGRQYVHMSSNKETAISVSLRRTNEPVILVINSQKMYEDGVEFYQSSNGVWLVGHVGVEYIEQILQNI